MEKTTPTINEVLDEFLADHQKRLGRSTQRKYEEVISLFRACMDDYGHQWLSAEEAELFEREYGQDEERGSFCNIFGPDKVPENLDEFLSWFLIRKTMASKATLQVAPTVMEKLVGWLVQRGYVSPEAADGSKEMIDEARSLPKADELSTRLYHLTEQEVVDPVIETQDWENEMAVITRIERETILLQNEETEVEVSLRVPADVAALAEIDWRISALHFARTSEGWYLLEMGNVYPI